jgi:hypothetical protein
MSFGQHKERRHLIFFKLERLLMPFCLLKETAVPVPRINYIYISVFESIGEKEKEEKIINLVLNVFPSS